MKLHRKNLRKLILKEIRMLNEATVEVGHPIKDRMGAYSFDLMAGSNNVSLKTTTGGPHVVTQFHAHGPFDITVNKQNFKAIAVDIDDFGRRFVAEVVLGKGLVGVVINSSTNQTFDVNQVINLSL